MSNEDDISFMVKEYLAAGNSDAERAEAVARLSEKFDVSKPSIRAKLVAADVYIRKTYQTKNGGPKETKNDIVDSISSALQLRYMISLSDGECESLEKANKSVLIKLEKALQHYL